MVNRPRIGFIQPQPDETPEKTKQAIIADALASMPDAYTETIVRAFLEWLNYEMDGGTFMDNHDKTLFDKINAARTLFRKGGAL